jgi:hypothetical protein
MGKDWRRLLPPHLDLHLEVFVPKKEIAAAAGGRAVTEYLQLDWMDDGTDGWKKLHTTTSFTICNCTSLNPMPNAQVCVYLTIHITKLQVQTTFPKPLYIPHSACIHQDPGC